VSKATIPRDETASGDPGRDGIEEFGEPKLAAG